MCIRDRYRTHRNYVAALCQFGNGDVAVDVDGSSGLQQFGAQLLTVQVEHHTVLEYAKVDLVPVFVKHLKHMNVQYTT